MRGSKVVTFGESMWSRIWSSAFLLNFVRVPRTELKRMGSHDSTYKGPMYTL